MRNLRFKRKAKSTKFGDSGKHEKKGIAALHFTASIKTETSLKPKVRIKLRIKLNIF